MNKSGGRIVVGVDGSPSSHQALRWAAHQARVTGATLEVVTGWEYPLTYAWVPLDPSDSGPGDEAKRNLQATVAEILGDDPGVDITYTVVEGHAAAVLLAAAKGASHLVVGSRGHGGFTGVLLGSVSLHCVNHAKCPVTVVRDGGHHDGSDPE